MSAVKQYSYELDEPAKPGEGKPRRAICLKGRDLVRYDNPNIRTLWANFLNGVHVAGERPCFGVRVGNEFQWETYNEVKNRVINIGSALSHHGIQQNDNLGLYAVNRPEWVIAEQACNGFGFVSVPLYDTLGAEAITYIITQTEMKVVFLTSDKFKNLESQLDSLPTLKSLVFMDALPQNIAESCKNAGRTAFTFKEFEHIGSQHKFEPAGPRPDDLATICYTSGTTGLPKGVMLTHENMISDAAAVVFLGRRGEGLEVVPDDVHLSYLPLAHAFEREVQVFLLGCGARIGFYSGDTNKLLEDIAILKPTFFPSVPRLLNRIYDKVLAGVNEKGGIAKFLFETAYNSKKQYLREGYLTHWLWDRVVFSAIRQKLGGRVKGIITGSAPINPDVMDFLRICFSCDVYEGYGQTESTAGSTLTIKNDLRPGHVGPPLPCNDIKLVDVPEMGYTSADKPYPRGEVCFRGYNVFKGYYKQPDKTTEALDEDGWLHSGDIGLWDEQGCLRIIDRKKNIFKLAQGEYLAPEKIENIFCKNSFVAQAFVHGDSLKHYCIAVIVPDEEALTAWCGTNGITGTFPEICQNPKVKEHLLAEICTTGRESGLKSFELPKNIFVSPISFSVENDILTPTFKLKRNQAKKAYEKEIGVLHEETDSKEALTKK